jgi:hypothetical protein
MASNIHVIKVCENRQKCTKAQMKSGLNNFFFGPGKERKQRGEKSANFYNFATEFSNYST